MAITSRTYDTRKAKLLRWMKRWSKNGSQPFTMSSAWLQHKFGTAYARMLREIAAAYGLVVTKEATLGFYEGTDVIRRGTCREYAFPGALPPVPVDSPVPSPEDLDPEAREFLAVYEGSNLAELGIEFAFKTGRDGDGRVYTSLTRHSPTHDGPLMLAGENAVEVDIPNAFAAFLISECPSAEDHLRLIANTGVLYETLMDATGVTDRSLVKKTVNIILNHKGCIQFRSRDSEGWWLPQSEEEFLMQRVAKYMSLAYPKFYNWARKEARAGRTYDTASQIERRVMRECKRMLKNRVPSNAFARKHDAILVARPYEKIVREILRRVLVRVLRQPSTKSPSLFVTSRRAARIEALLAKQWTPSAIESCREWIPRALQNGSILSDIIRRAYDIQAKRYARGTVTPITA